MEKSFNAGEKYGFDILVAYEVTASFDQEGSISEIDYCGIEVDSIPLKAFPDAFRKRITALVEEDFKEVTNGDIIKDCPEPNREEDV